MTTQTQPALPTQTQQAPTAATQQPGAPTDFQQLLDKPHTSKPMEFVPFGANDRVKLTVEIVQKLIAVRTKTGKTCSDRDAIRFMMMCQSKRLNPFEGDAYLIGYDTQDGPQFSLVTAHQTYLKRAEVHPEYDGMESGVILLQQDGTTSDRKGDFHLPDEQVVGAWATVHFKNRKHPTERRGRMARFAKNFGVWRDDAAGMLVKCVEADALRSSFPSLLGGLYLNDEIDLIKKETDIPIEVDTRRLVEVRGAPHRTDNGPTLEKPIDDGEGTDLGPQKKASEAAATLDHPEMQLERFVLDGGFTFSHFQSWGDGSGVVPTAGSMAGFDDVPSDLAKRILRDKAGLLKGLKMAKDGAK